GKALEPRYVGHVRRGQTANGGDEILCQEGAAVRRRHPPAICRLVIVRGDDAGLELDIAPEIEAVGNVIEIAPDLGVGGIALAPLPLLEQLLAKRIAIGVALGVAARTGVPVPVPGPPDPRTRFQDPGRQPQPVAQGEQLVEPGKSRANDQGIEGSHTLLPIPWRCRHACHRSSILPSRRCWARLCGCSPALPGFSQGGKRGTPPYRPRARLALKRAPVEPRFCIGALLRAVAGPAAAGGPPAKPARVDGQLPVALPALEGAGTDAHQRLPAAGPSPREVGMNKATGKSAAQRRPFAFGW